MEWEFPSGRWLVGDCLERMAEIADGSVDMVLCDLPYGTTQNKWDTVIPFEPLWREYWRICKPNAAVVLTAQAPFDKILGVSQIRYLKYEWIWEKTAATGHLNANRAPLKAHENILVFCKNQSTYNPIKTSGHIRKRATSLADKASSNYGAQIGKRWYDSTDRFPRSIVEFARDQHRGNLHPTQKPVALFEYLIRTYTNPGELVLDNTAGSGTTAIAAINAGRRWTCIERGLDYSLAALDRITRHVPAHD